LKKLSQSDNKSLRESIIGILFMLAQHKPVSPDKSVSQSNVHPPDKDRQHDETAVNHIMISYQWGSQPLIKRIASHLKELGYNIWIDIEEMQGSTLDAMASAVEGSSVVLIGMTKKYKESPNCRSEAEYTNKLRKHFIPLILEPNYTPDGWLGLMLGEKLYYPISEENFEDMMQSLIKVLGNKGKPKSSESEKLVGSSTSLTTDHLALKKTFSTVVVENPIPKWSVDDVVLWLRKENLSQFENIFIKQQISGNALSVLIPFVHKKDLDEVVEVFEKQFVGLCFGQYLELIAALLRLR